MQGLTKLALAIAIVTIAVHESGCGIVARSVGLPNFGVNLGGGLGGGVGGNLGANVVAALGQAAKAGIDTAVGVAGQVAKSVVDLKAKEADLILGGIGSALNIGQGLAGVIVGGNVPQGHQGGARRIEVTVNRGR